MVTIPYEHYLSHAKQNFKNPNPPPSPKNNVTLKNYKNSKQTLV